MSDDAPLLEADGLTKRFGGLTAVDALSFSVREGEILGVIGPNGAGKSTVFNCVMGQYDVTDGTIRFAQHDITEWDTHDIVNEGLARVSQESRPLDGMTVRENIRLFTVPNSIFSFRGGASDEEIESIASRVGLEGVLEQKPPDLTHEFTRRLEIARALATDPDVLLLDEPFAGFTQEEVADLRSEIASLNEDDGITLVVVDHNMKGLMPLVNRVVVIHDGALLTTGTPDEIADDQDVANVYLGNTGETA